MIIPVSRLQAFSIIIAVITVLLPQQLMADWWRSFTHHVSQTFHQATQAVQHAAQAVQHTAQQTYTAVQAQTLSTETNDLFRNANQKLGQALAKALGKENDNKPKKPTAPPPLPPQTAKINIFDPATFPAGTARYNNAYVFTIPTNISAVFGPDIQYGSGNDPLRAIESVNIHRQADVTAATHTPFILIRLDANGTPINLDGSQSKNTVPSIASFVWRTNATVAADGELISYLLVQNPSGNSNDLAQQITALLNSDIAVLSNNIYVFQPGTVNVF
ncbi:hypothetical protein M1466_03860 [Candidatus Dependentiae bacterium]|nr:hypothetical protein [Candidatus Dependentiae bacterium]